MDAWLSEQRDVVAGAAGLGAPDVELAPGDARHLLDVARIAAHDSGQRTNAPLLCYLIGLAAGKSGVDVATLVAAITPND